MVRPATHGREHGCVASGSTSDTARTSSTAASSASSARDDGDHLGVLLAAKSKDSSH